MYCEKCGNEVKNNINFCPICGQDMKNVKAKNEEVKQKIIKDLSVALPIYKGLADICTRGMKVEELLNKTYEKKRYGTPLTTLLVYFFKAWAKWVIACLILTVITSPILGLLGLIFKDAFAIISFLWKLLIYILGVVAVIMYTKIKRDNYRKEMKKIEQEAEDYLEQHSCDEIYLLPDGYQKYDAAKYVYESLVSGKASTLEEAIKLYDRHCQKENSKK